MNYTFKLYSKYEQFITKNSLSVENEPPQFPVVFIFRKDMDQLYPPLNIYEVDCIAWLYQAKEFISRTYPGVTWDEVLLFMENKVCREQAAFDKSYSNFWEKVQHELLTDSIEQLPEETEFEKLKHFILTSMTQVFAKEKTKENKENFQRFYFDITNNNDMFYDQANSVWNYIIQNLPEFLQNIIESERKIPLYLVEQSDYQKQYLQFQNMYHAFKSSVDLLYSHTRLNSLKNYQIEVESNTKLSTHNRGLIKSFYPAGVCRYGKCVTLNTNLWTSRHKWGKLWTECVLLKVLWHELGHAVDHAHKTEPHVKHGSNLIPIGKTTFLGNKPNPPFFSDDPNILTATRKSYRNRASLNRNQKKRVDYYVTPKVVTRYNSQFPDVHIPPDWSSPENPISPIKYNWKSTRREAFAESFAILTHWFIRGFSCIDTYTVIAQKSSDRLAIKTLMPVLRYMLKHTNWESVGIPSHLFNKRKKLILHFLNKIETLPIVYSSKVKCYKKRTAKTFLMKKPITRKLIN